MSKQELLKFDPKKSFRKELMAFFGFSAFVMVPLAWLVLEQLSKH